MAVIDFLNRPFEDVEKEEIGIGGFTALVRVSESTSLTSQAPTTFLEDGSFAQDHIVLEPMVLTIDGDVSEVHVRPSTLDRVQTIAQEKAGAITTYLPSKTKSQIQNVLTLEGSISERIRQIDRTISNGGRQALEFLGNQSVDFLKPWQEKFIDAMEALHYGKQLVSIDMPYRRHDNMRITSIQITRDNKGRNVKFKLTAQKIRFAETIYVEVSSFVGSPSGGLNGQTDGVTDKGPQAGEEADKSLLFSMFG